MLMMVSKKGKTNCRHINDKECVKSLFILFDFSAAFDA